MTSAFSGIESAGSRGKNAKTLQERMGFKDPDLTTPKHDEIMLWLDRNMGEILIRAYDIAPLTDPRFQALQDEHDLKPNPLRIEKDWERPIIDGGPRGTSCFTVAFMDMFVRATWDRPEVNDKGEYFLSRDEIFAMEVKPTIRSLGELIRQIRHQETYLPQQYGYNEITSVVVSPDTRFREQLISQGIEFIEVPEDMKDL